MRPAVGTITRRTVEAADYWTDPRDADDVLKY